MKIKVKKFYILGAICAILVVVSIFLTIEMSSSGVEISDLEKNEAALSDQKRTLEESLVKNLSTSELTEKSLEMGFIKPANLVYVTEVPPVANLP